MNTQLTAGAQEMDKRRPAGQAIVVAALAMVAIVGGMGLIIDGGNAFAQQRMTQAGNDAVSEGGATVINQHDANPTLVPPAGTWDAQVESAILANATNNSIIIICTQLHANKPDGTCGLYFSKW